MDGWELKPCSNLHRMLKIRTNIEPSLMAQYPFLITIVNRYTASDDLHFPDPNTLAFFSSFEQTYLYSLKDALYVAQDIDVGFLKIYIYAKNYQRTIYQTMKHLTLQPKHSIDFIVTKDPDWDHFKDLRR